MTKLLRSLNRILTLLVLVINVRFRGPRKSWLIPIKILGVDMKRIGPLLWGFDSVVRFEEAGNLESVKGVLLLTGESANACASQRLIHWATERELHVVQDARHGRALSEPGVWEARLLRVLGARVSEPWVDFIDDTASPPPLLTRSLTRRATNVLEQQGFNPSVPFVLMHARSQDYLRFREPSSDWTHHDFRDFPTADLIPAMNLAGSLGLCVILIGMDLSTRSPQLPANVLALSRIVDRDPSVDLFAGGNCLLYLGSDSGAAELAAVSRKPTAFVNWTYFPNFSTLRRNLTLPFIPKLFKCSACLHPLSLEECGRRGLLSIQSTATASDSGVFAVNSRPDHIASLLSECLGRLGYRAWEDDGDATNRAFVEEGQESFRSQLSKALEAPVNTNITLGESFLIDNQHWLDDLDARNCQCRLNLERRSHS